MADQREQSNLLAPQRVSDLQGARNLARTIAGLSVSRAGSAVASNKEPPVAAKHSVSLLQSIGVVGLQSEQAVE